MDRTGMAGQTAENSNLTVVDELLTFQSFQTAAEAESLVRLLREHHIYCELGKSRPVLDKVLIGEHYENFFYVKIQGKDFTHANTILESMIRRNLEVLPADYYLYSFNTEELQQIIAAPDEWSRQDYVLAMDLLERKRSLTDTQIETLRKERTEALSQPEKGSMGWIILGYLFAILSSLIGLIIALSYITNRKILPDGRKVFAYDAWTRTHGKIIFGISLLMIAIALVFKNYFLAVFGILLYPVF
jgi:hypothetical protein